MDPLSIAVSVAGLLALTIQLVEVGTKYGNASPKAKGFDLLFELRALTDVLKRLKNFLEGPDAPSTFDQMSTFLSSNTRCQSKLQELLRKLQRTIHEENKVRKAVDRLLWPLAEKEHREAIEDIHRYTQVFNFALTVEGCALLAKSSVETSAALKLQAQKMEETRQLCGAIPDLVAQIDASLNQMAIISSFVQGLPNVSEKLASISHGIAHLKIAADKQESRHGEAERKRILSWLSPLSFEGKQRQLFERRQPGTGEWLVQHETFQKWKASSGSTLWCSGIPGAGKTIMASIVIDTLQKETKGVVDTVPIAFIYADYQSYRQQSSVNLVSAITRQLATQNPAILNAAFSAYQERTAQSQHDEVPNLDMAAHLEILRQGLTHVNRCFVVVDAVDELPDKESTEDSDVRFELLHTLAQLESVSVLCTSRPHVKGSLYFSNLSELTIEAKDADLRIFLEDTIANSRRLGNFFSSDLTLRDEIIVNIIQKAGGMFLMAGLQAEEVKTALTVRQARVVLSKLSGKINDMYGKTLSRIKEQPSSEAKLGLRAISWVARVQRPLSVPELVQAMSLEEDDQVLDESSLVDVDIILGASGGLLQLQSSSFHGGEIVGFAHYSIQEYLDSVLDDVAINSDIANTCLTYLCLEGFRKLNILGMFHPELNRLYPLQRYAQLYSIGHVKTPGVKVKARLKGRFIAPTCVELSKSRVHHALKYRWKEIVFIVMTVLGWEQTIRHRTKCGLSPRWPHYGLLVLSCLTLQFLPLLILHVQMRIRTVGYMLRRSFSSICLVFLLTVPVCLRFSSVFFDSLHLSFCLPHSVGVYRYWYLLILVEKIFSPCVPCVPDRLDMSVYDARPSEAKLLGRFRRFIKQS
jgi:hypothetical protein